MKLRLLAATSKTMIKIVRLKMRKFSEKGPLNVPQTSILLIQTQKRQQNCSQPRGVQAVRGGVLWEAR